MVEHRTGGGWGGCLCGEGGGHDAKLKGRSGVCTYTQSRRARSAPLHEKGHLTGNHSSLPPLALSAS